LKKGLCAYEELSIKMQMLCEEIVARRGGVALGLALVSVWIYISVSDSKNADGMHGESYDNAPL
jgi:hypothetical protein